MAEDFVPQTGGVAAQTEASVVPALRKHREGRAPASLVMPARSKVGAARPTTRSRGFFFLAACFLQVYERKHGNRPFFALLPPSSLIPCTLTFVNRKLLCSSRLGVTCPYSPLQSSAKNSTPKMTPPGPPNAAARLGISTGIGQLIAPGSGRGSENDWME
jgi:hypothetical protein